MEITFKRRFEAAHRFIKSNSKCATPHGHTWWITLTLNHSPNLIQNEINFSYDFKHLKKDWHKYVDEELDHHFFVNAEDPLLNYLKELQPDLLITSTDGDPTTETLALTFLKKALQIFSDFKGVEVKSLYLEETPTNGVRVFATDILGCEVTSKA